MRERRSANRARQRDEHVVTFEDPIEYIYPGGTPSLMSQREIGEDDLDFALDAFTQAGKATGVLK